MKALNVDTERMRRVLDRLYPDRRPPPPPPHGGDACALLGKEQRVNELFRFLLARSGECRRRLQGALQRNEQRVRFLRGECFLRRGARPLSPGRRPEGVLSVLRELYHTLEQLGGEYETAAGTMPRRRENMLRFSGQCRADARLVREALDAAMR